MAFHAQNGRFKETEKLHFRVKVGVRFKIKLKIVFKTINFIFPENLGLLGLFLSKIEEHEKNAPLPQKGQLYITKGFFKTWYIKYNLFSDHLPNFSNFCPFWGIY